MPPHPAQNASAASKSKQHHKGQSASNHSSARPQQGSSSDKRSGSQPNLSKAGDRRGPTTQAPSSKPSSGRIVPQDVGNNRIHPGKRKDSPADEDDDGWQPNKKPKARPGMRRASVRDIRAIAAQHTDAALKDGQLDLQAFANSRKFEISALDESMRRTKIARTTRAFQQVPHSLRRRSGAHNPKRTPSRLQKKAIKEMNDDNTPLVNSKTRRQNGKKKWSSRAWERYKTAQRLGVLARRQRRKNTQKQVGDGKLAIDSRIPRPKIRRDALNDPVIVATKFRKRQKEKTWLPTHIWHAKRATMTPPTKPMWRFAIPLTPAEKVYRPTHRIQWEKGAMVWDTSYISTIGLTGTYGAVQNVLKRLGITQETMWEESQKGTLWRSGDIHLTHTLTKTRGDSTRVIGPATTIWNAQDPEGNDNEAKIRGQQASKVFIRLHPSVFLETFNELLHLVRQQTPKPYVEDLRYEIGSIELAGPDATEALLGVLKPHHKKSYSTAPHAIKFGSLAGLKDSSNLPTGSLFAFSIADPRLHYPPRAVALPNLEDSGAQLKFLQNISSRLAERSSKPHALFSRDARFNGSKLPSQKSLNRRRGNKAPGTTLEPTLVDPAIPVIVYATRPQTSSKVSGTWTLMLPWKCVLPVWYSIMHYPLSTGGNPGFGGLNEMRQMAFERGTPWFPADFPGTDAGAAWELEQRQARKRAYDRMPKGKRVNFENLDLGAGRKGEVGHGLHCDYEALLRGCTSSGDHPAQPDPSTEKEATIHLSPLAGLDWLSKPHLEFYVNSKTVDAVPAAVCHVKVIMLSRGVPEECARVYRLPLLGTARDATQAEVPATYPNGGTGGNGLAPDLRDQWLAKMPRKTVKSHARKKRSREDQDVDLETRTRRIAQELMAPPQPYPPPAANQNNINGHPLCPDPEDLLGFITAGSFNLRDGKGEGIGSISAARAMEELRRHKNKDDPAARICVVRNAGQNIGWIARWELI